MSFWNSINTVSFKSHKKKTQFACLGSRWKIPSPFVKFVQKFLTVYIGRVYSSGYLKITKLKLISPACLYFQNSHKLDNINHQPAHTPPFGLNFWSHSHYLETFLNKKSIGKNVHHLLIWSTLLNEMFFLPPMSRFWSICRDLAFVEQWVEKMTYAVKECSLGNLMHKST